MIPLHNTSKELRSGMGDLMKRIRAPESTKRKKIGTQGSDELEDGEHDGASDEIDNEMENLREETDKI